MQRKNFPDLGILNRFLDIYDEVLKKKEVQFFASLKIFVATTVGYNNPTLVKQTIEELRKDFELAAVSGNWADVICKLGREAHKAEMTTPMNFSVATTVFHFIRSYLLQSVEWTSSLKSSELKSTMTDEKKQLADPIKAEITEKINLLKKSLIEPQAPYLDAMINAGSPIEDIKAVETAYKKAKDTWEKDLCYLGDHNSGQQKHFRKDLFPEREFTKAQPGYEYDSKLVNFFLPNVLHKDYWLYFIKDYEPMACLAEERNPMVLMHRLEEVYRAKQSSAADLSLESEKDKETSLNKSSGDTPAQSPQSIIRHT